MLVLFKMEPTVGLGLAAAVGGSFAAYKVPQIGSIQYLSCLVRLSDHSSDTRKPATIAARIAR